MPQALIIQILVILAATILFGLAILLLSFYNRLFAAVKVGWLRRNLAVLSVGVVFTSAFLVLQSPELFAKISSVKGVAGIIVKELLKAFIIIIFVYNIVWAVSRIPAIKAMSFIKHHAIVTLSIVVSAVFIYSVINYIDYGMSFAKLHYALLYAYFNSVCTGLVYTAINYVELDRKRKLNEKELEVTKLIALKTKAELDALHSKINPHFLYNALNSIADLAITDGKKARKMTIALADLFRYSINYADHNYSTVKEEAEMAEVYLQIEKIRFEDQLSYSLQVDEELNHFLVPRFVLQPVVENAVKHGLKATGKMTEIKIEVKKNNNGLQIIVADNGPLFPDDLIPGYGVKSMYDKLDLLFPDAYEVHFTNQPIKQVAIHIHKLMKNEPGV